MTDKKILEIDTVGSQDRPINEEDREAFNDYFRKRKAIELIRVGHLLPK